MVMSCKPVVQYHNQNIDTDKLNMQNISTPEVSLTLPCYGRTHYPPVSNSYLIADNHLPLFHFHNSVISRMIYKLNYTVRNLLGLTFH